MSRLKTKLVNYLASCKSKDLPTSRKLTRLSGPCSFVYFPNIEEGMRILILGEFHQVDRLCESIKGYEVQNWLWDLAQDATECLDIFVESFYRVNLIGNFDSKLESFPNPLLAIRQQFEDCTTGNCPPALRYHYVDLRSFQLEKKLYDNLLKIALRFSAVGTNAVFEEKWEDDLRLIRDFYLGFDQSQEMLAQKYFTELAEDIDLKSFDWELIKKEIQEISRLISKQLQKSMLFLDKVQKVIDLWPVENFMSFMNLGMDLYLLARLFSTFDKAKLQRGPLFCRDIEFKKIKNAIIYCGDNHQKFFTFFLEYYFKVQPEIEIPCEIGRHPNQCLHFNTPFDFFEIQM